MEVTTTESVWAFWVKGHGHQKSSNIQIFSNGVKLKEEKSHSNPILSQFNM